MTTDQEESVEQEVTTVTIPSTPSKVVTKTKKVLKPDIRTEHPQKVYDKKKTIFRTYQVIWYIVGFVETLLAFRILLKFIGASPYSGFTRFIYLLTSPFASPFIGVVGPTIQGNSVIEWSTFIAMAVYALVSYGIIELLQFIKPTSPEEVEQTVDSV